MSIILPDRVEGEEGLVGLKVCVCVSLSVCPSVCTCDCVLCLVICVLAGIMLFCYQTNQHMRWQVQGVSDFFCIL